MKRTTISGIALSAVLAAGLVGADKASFLTEKEASFIRPGLQFEILSAEVGADNKVRYVFSVRDRAGAPLDVAGVETPGAIRVRAVLARIPAGQKLYRAYTARTATSSSTGMSAEQATFETASGFELIEPGVYAVTIDTAISGSELNVTHTVAAWAQRDLSEFDLGTAYEADTFDWVPDGSTAPRVELSVTDAKCNQCHGNLSAHDNRTEVAVCITCHQPQSADPDTGNTVDMAVMTHKIHMGEELPSVQAGQPYQIIGFRNSVHDYSEVVFPADVRNCQSCHVEDLGAVSGAAAVAELRTPLRGRSSARIAAKATAEPPIVADAETVANAHLMNPSARTCGSCHDDVNFRTGENHAGGLPQPNDSQCSRCHVPQGELEFDISVLGAHTIERFSTELPGTNFEILDVQGAPGEAPTVTFSITNDAGDPVPPSSMGRLALVLAATDGGDFSQFWSEDATVAEGSGGVFFYTFQDAVIPDDATGTWAVGIEGYQNATILAGTVQERSVRDAGQNDVSYFNVGGGSANVRRTIVQQTRCDSCHNALDIHGSNRNNVEHCVLCHNPNQTDVRRRPEEAGAAESVNFKEMIHRIHAGPAQIRDYTIYGFGNRPHNYNHVEYPRSLAECSACHVEGAEQLPLAADLLPTVDPRGFFNPAPPATGSCLSCHADVASAAHAELNISPSFGESCDVCHGAGSEFAVDKSHAQ